MYLTREQCNELLEPFFKESVGLLNEYHVLSQEFNLNDFNPNENRIAEIQTRVKILNKIVEEIKNYQNVIQPLYKKLCKK